MKTIIFVTNGIGVPKTSQNISYNFKKIIGRTDIRLSTYGIHFIVYRTFGNNYTIWRIR